MDTNLAEFLKQLPFVAITLGVVVFFVRLMREDREKSDVREARRDEEFTSAMRESSIRTSDALDRNSSAIRELDKTILGLRLTNGNEMDARRRVGD